MSNICNDDSVGFGEQACFSHWFSRKISGVKEFTQLFLRKRDVGNLQFYHDDFLLNMIPEKVWEHITVEDKLSSPYNPDDIFPRAYRFDVEQVDAKSMFFALTAMRYPCEFPKITQLYQEAREKWPKLSRELAFIWAHCEHGSHNHNFNHTLTHYSLFAGLEDSVLETYRFQWPKLNKKEPYILNSQVTRETGIFATLTLTGANPYGWWDRNGTAESTLCKQIERIAE